jgi:hypothetical protein
MEIDPAARRHGVSDDDMMHAVRHYWRSFETDNDSVVVYVGPGLDAGPLEVVVLNDDDGTAIIHAMPARWKYLKGWWSR